MAKTKYDYDNIHDGAAPLLRSDFLRFASKTLRPSYLQEPTCGVSR